MHIILINYIILIIAFNDRYVVTSCTSWWAAGDSMPLITAKSGREMLASWARMKFSLFCLTSLRGFCSFFTLIFLPADRCDFDVHGALLDDKVHKYVIL
jgi:hypothetical protein